jgi:simple sugar transport system permease protein
MRERLRAVIPSAVPILLSLFGCFLAVVLSRGPGVAVDAFSAMFAGAFGDWPRFFASGDAGQVLRPLGEAANKAAILTLTGLSVAVAFKVGLFNIGAQGQLTVGALAAAVVGAKLELPAVVHLPLCLLAAALAGGAWAALPAVLKTRRGVHEVISTIMMNWIAVSLVENWLVVGPLKATASGVNSISGTDQIQPTAELPRLLEGASRLNGGLVLALVVALATWVFFARLHRGFGWRVVGLNAEAARAAGLDVGRVVTRAMMLAGAFAGLAGAVLVLGTEQKYPTTLGAPYGFDGIAMALLGQGEALGVLLTSLVFGALRAGGTRLQLFGVHKSFPELIQGFALLLVAARLVWERLARWLVPDRKAAKHG